MKLFNVSAYIIHPMCPMEEKASRGRISVCINPPAPPTMAFTALRVTNRRGVGLFSLRIHSGAIFCQVDKSKLDFQLRFFITDGYQLWKGDTPSFISIAIQIVSCGNDLRIGPARNRREAYA